MASSSSDPLRFALIGHVDHGKSTLGGRILVETGEVTERDVEKAREDAKASHMESWALAYLLDSNPTERSSGKTQEYITFTVHHGPHPLTLVDVPGHAKLITEMISGVSVSDIVVLVCSVRGDELQQGIRGQSYEHLLIARGMGIGKLIVAVNKMDAVGWDEDVFSNAKKVIAQKIERLGFVSVEYVPVSALTGENVAKPRDGGECLLDVIARTKVNKNRPGNAVMDIESKRVKVNVVFVSLGGIVISKGYECVLHSQSLTTAISVLGIHSRNKIITSKREGEVITITIGLSNDVRRMCRCFVLRVGDNTIGVGKIVIKE